MVAQLAVLMADLRVVETAVSLAVSSVESWVVN